MKKILIVMKNPLNNVVQYQIFKNKKITKKIMMRNLIKNINQNQNMKYNRMMRKIVKRNILENKHQNQIINKKKKHCQKLIMKLFKEN